MLWYNYECLVYVVISASCRAVGSAEATTPGHTAHRKWYVIVW